MKVRIVVIGKTFQQFVGQGVQEYLTRLKRFVNVEYIELPDVKNTRNMPIDQIQAKEASMLNKYFNCDYNVLLDEKGKEMTSEQFASWIAEKMNMGYRCIGFFVGGPYGFHEDLKKKYQKLSLSRMTFSHQLIRLIFAEQLYRAFTIINSLPYHH